MSDEVLLASLLSAVERAPDDVALRVHVACVLMDAGRPGEALAHCAAALVIEPGHPGALVALVQATSRLTGGAEGAAADVPLQLSPKAWRPARPEVLAPVPSTGKQPNSRWRARARLGLRRRHLNLPHRRRPSRRPPHRGRDWEPTPARSSPWPT